MQHHATADLCYEVFFCYEWIINHPTDRPINQSVNQPTNLKNNKSSNSNSLIIFPSFVQWFIIMLYYKIFLRLFSIVFGLKLMAASKWKSIMTSWNRIPWSCTKKAIIYRVGCCADVLLHCVCSSLDQQLHSLAQTVHKHIDTLTPAVKCSFSILAIVKWLENQQSVMSQRHHCGEMNSPHIY